MYRNFVKLAFDVIGATVFSILTFPIALLVALIVVLESPGSPIFVQKRIGRNCKPFNIFKFRTMVKDAASIGPHFTDSLDPRVTRVGRILRKLSLDEVPQIWNIALGQMSLIGPRPDVPLQERDYRPEDWRLRHTVRPGITGLAQVSGRSSLTAASRLSFDLEYARNCGPLLDAKIFFRTFFRLTKLQETT